MCNCIECVGDQPEPVANQTEDGKWTIVYKDSNLTQEYDTEAEAWNEFDERLTLRGGGKMKRYSIGIDPGKKTGFAVYDILKDTLHLQTLDFWNVMDEMDRIGSRVFEEIYEVTVEVPTSKHVWHGKGPNQKSASKVGVNVGGVIREAELLAEGIRRMGFNVRTVHPRGKVDAAKFEAFTGYQGRTNEHTRDAGLLCFRRKP